MNIQYPISNFEFPRKVFFTFCLLFLVSGGVLAQGILSPAQIGDFRTRWLDTKKKKTILFMAGFEQVKMNPKLARHKDKIQTYKRNGKVPFRLWCDFGEVWEFKGGSKSPELLISQPVYYYIKNKAGKVVKKDSSSIGKITKRGSTGGIFSDLPKADTYTCVIYVKKEKMLFGKEMTATFTGYK